MFALEYGIRAAGTVELAGTTKKVNKSRLNYIHHYAKQLIPKLQEYFQTNSPRLFANN